MILFRDFLLISLKNYCMQLLISYFIQNGNSKRDCVSRFVGGFRLGDLGKSCPKFGISESLIWLFRIFFTWRSLWKLPFMQSKIGQEFHKSVKISKILTTANFYEYDNINLIPTNRWHIGSSIVLSFRQDPTH